MNKENEQFYKGVAHGRNQILMDLLTLSDKLEMLHAIFAKTSLLAKQETDPVKKAQLDGYSEGFRHSLNIVKNLGNAFDAYDNIINPSIKIPLTKQELSLFRGR